MWCHRIRSQPHWSCSCLRILRCSLQVSLSPFLSIFIFRPPNSACFCTSIFFVFILRNLKNGRNCSEFVIGRKKEVFFSHLEMFCEKTVQKNEGKQKDFRFYGFSLGIKFCNWKRRKFCLFPMKTGKNKRRK